MSGLKKCCWNCNHVILNMRDKSKCRCTATESGEPEYIPFDELKTRCCDKCYVTDEFVNTFE